MRGVVGDVQGIEDAGKQGGGGRTTVHARRARAHPPGREEDDREGHWWAGPASYSVGPVGGAR